jgi:protein phosphatase 1L
LEPGGSTAVTAVLIDGKDLLMVNVEDSRAVLSKGGVVE